MGPDAPYEPGDGKHSSDIAVGSEAIDASTTRDAGRRGRRGPTTQARALAQRELGRYIKDISTNLSPSVRVIFILCWANV